MGALVEALFSRVIWWYGIIEYIMVLYNRVEHLVHAVSLILSGILGVIPAWPQEGLRLYSRPD